MWNVRFRNACDNAQMLETSVRMLRLLSILQSRRDWSGTELAERLGVTTRTVRNDIGRLRIIGYQVDSTTGANGGYRLGAGSELPPLLLDADETVAVAVGLSMAASASVDGVGEPALRALAKLEQTIPVSLRGRVSALRSAVEYGAEGGPAVSASTLTAVAAATHNHEVLRFDYTGRGGEASVRQVQPHTLVHSGHRWYLLAWDVDRDDWRTFRIDRIEPRMPTHKRFPPREAPAGGALAYVERNVAANY